MTAAMRPFAVSTEATSSVCHVDHHSERVNSCSLAQTLLLVMLVMLRWRMMMNVITRTNYVPRNVEHLSPPRRYFAPPGHMFPQEITIADVILTSNVTVTRQLQRGYYRGNTGTLRS